MSPWCPFASLRAISSGGQLAAENREPNRLGYGAGKVLARAESSIIKVFFVIFLKLSLSLPLLPVVLEVFAPD